MLRAIVLAILSLASGICLSQVNNPCQPPTAFTTLEVNEVKAGLLNGGDFWWNLNDAVYEVPKGSGVHSIFSGGLWIGGIDAGGKLKVAAQTYRQGYYDYWPGPLGVDDAATEPVCWAYDRFWRITRSDMETFRDLCDQYLVQPGDTIPAKFIPKDIREWPASGNKLAKGANGESLQIPVGKNLAPYIEVNGIPGYNPRTGDCPKIRGEEAVWWVINDMGAEHTSSGGDPLGVEVSVMAYGFNWPSYLRQTTFYHFDIVNYGSDLFDIRLGMLVDFDLGYPFDDYVGCDSTRSLGIGYNGDSIDGPGINVYGENPPFIGVDLLRGPKGDDGDDLSMTSFMAYESNFAATGNPTLPEHYYNYLQARWLDSTHLTWGGSGYGGSQKVNYIFPSEPDQAGWSECALNNNPFNRRMVMGTGPLTFEQYERISFDLAVIWRQCDPEPWCPSFRCIQIISDVVQAWFDAVYPPVGIPSRTDRNKSSVSIYPNPASSKAEVRFSQPLNHSYHISAFDLKGRKIYESNQQIPGNGSHEIDVSEWSPGVFLVQIETGLGIPVLTRLVVGR